MSGARPEAREDARDAGRPGGVDPKIYRSVLDTIESGVISVETGGVITSFNKAAETITGLKGESVVGHTFVEIFSVSEGMDQLSDVILDAVYNASVVHQRVITATLGGVERSLSTATRYLREERNGKMVRIGVVAVFDDITELRKLREAELRLGQEVQTKHTELQEAYQDLEETIRRLGTASRRINVVRVGAAVAVLALLVMIGLYVWDAGPGISEAVSGPAPAVAGDLDVLVVEPGPIASSISMIGRLAPRREVEVTSPINGKVAQVHVHAGEWVIEGQPLVEMDGAEIRIEHRDARVAYIKALDRVEELEGWSDHADVSRARRALSKTRLALEARKNQLSETTFLLERGLIPASEHAAAEREHHNQLLDLESAEQDLQAVLARGTEDIEVARLELDNARARLASVEETLSRTTVTSPATGVVMYPEGGEGGGSGSGEADRKLARGASVEQGERLLTIGDLDGFTVAGHVDEADVTRVRPGHPATVTGDAFPGMVLHGEVVRVSSQAAAADQYGSSLPSFEVAAVLEDLTEAQRGLLRLGMSARMEVVVYEKADALLVPIEAVDTHGGRPRLLVRNRDSGEVTPVEVVTGTTTLDSVEIVEGISAGDEILVGRS